MKKSQVLTDDKQNSKVLDTQIIDTIKKYEGIYNPKHPSYFNNDDRHLFYNLVAGEINENFKTSITGIN